MRSAVLAMLLATHVASAAPAYDPDPVPEETPIAPGPSGYIQVGAHVGQDHDHGFGGSSVDAGYHVHGSSVWLHAGLTGGSAIQPISFGIGGEPRVTGSMHQLGGGIELRGECAATPVCAALGLDVGYVAFDFNEVDNYDAANTMSLHYTSAVAIPRVQLDFGGANVRFRPAIEFPVGPYFSGWHLSAALAAQF